MAPAATQAAARQRYGHTYPHYSDGHVPEYYNLGYCRNGVLGKATYPRRYNAAYYPSIRICRC